MKENKYSGKSIKDVYCLTCEKLRVRKNSHLLKTLPNIPNDFALLREIDLSLNFVGCVGIKPILEIIRICPTIQRLSAADNFLNNESVLDIVTILAHHEGLHHLDLSRNPISHAAGKALSKYVSNNPSVFTVLLEGTLINPALIRIIERKAHENKNKGGSKGGDSLPLSAATAASADSTPAAAPKIPAVSADKKKPVAPPVPATPPPADTKTVIKPIERKEAASSSPQASAPKETKPEHREPTSAQKAPVMGSLAVGQVQAKQDDAAGLLSFPCLKTLLECGTPRQQQALDGLGALITSTGTVNTLQQQMEPLSAVSSRVTGRTKASLHLEPLEVDAFPCLKALLDSTTPRQQQALSSLSVLVDSSVQATVPIELGRVEPAAKPQPPCESLALLTSLTHGQPAYPALALLEQASPSKSPKGSRSPKGGQKSPKASASPSPNKALSLLCGLSTAQYPALQLLKQLDENADEDPTLQKGSSFSMSFTGRPRSQSIEFEEGWGTGRKGSIIDVGPMPLLFESLDILFNLVEDHIARGKAKEDDYAGIGDLCDTIRGLGIGCTSSNLKGPLLEPLPERIPKSESLAVEEPKLENPDAAKVEYPSLYLLTSDVANWENCQSLKTLLSVADDTAQGKSWYALNLVWSLVGEETKGTAPTEEFAGLNAVMSLVNTAEPQV